MFTEKDLSDSLLQKIYSLVGSPDTVTGIPTQKTFLSVCMPGIPFPETALDFGFASMDKDQIELAADFSNLVNLIPMWGGSWKPSGRTLSQEYRKVVEQPKLPKATWSPSEEQQYKDANSYLWVKDRRLDSTTGRWVEVDLPSLAVQRYDQYEKAWNDARDAYDLAYSDYIARQNDPNEAQKWAARKPVLEDRVKRALVAWQGAGKGKVEEQRSLIARLDRKGLSTSWNDRFNRLDQPGYRQGSTAGDFLLTKYVPQKFWQEKAGWLTVSLSHKEVHKVDDSEQSNWGGGGSAGWGLWHFSGSADYESQKTYARVDMSDFSLSFEIATIPLLRGWLDPAVFWSRSWDMDRGLYPASENLSDGQYPPSGTMVMYPTTILFARNVSIKFSKSSQENRFAMEQIRGSASGGWGPFSFRANYFRRTTRTTHDFVEDGAGLTVPGMQIIGFGCVLLPKCPDPDSSLNW